MMHPRKWLKLALQRSKFIINHPQSPQVLHVLDHLIIPFCCMVQKFSELYFSKPMNVKIEMTLDILFKNIKKYYPIIASYMHNDNLLAKLHLKCCQKVLIVVHPKVINNSWCSMAWEGPLSALIRLTKNLDKTLALNYSNITIHQHLPNICP